MSITINGTTGIAGVDGSAGTPAVQGSDTNTGIFYPAADTVGVSTGGSERLRVDNSGNVGIGTSSPAAHLEISGTETGAGASLKLTNTTASTGKTWHLNSNNSGKLFFSIPSVVDAMIIDSSGNVLVGTTSTFGAGKTNIYYVPGTTTGISFLPSTNTGSPTPCNFLNAAGTSVGSITTTASATAYNTSSDYRLKNTIAPMTGALTKVQALKPVTYKWNIDDEVGEGFIAHELAKVCPHAVTGEKDAVDENGNPVYQSIDVSFLVATLTAAIQEQQALITTLTVRIEKLEKKS